MRGLKSVLVGMVAFASLVEIAAALPRNAIEQHRQHREALDTLPHRLAVRVTKVIRTLAAGEESGSCAFEGVVAKVGKSEGPTPVRVGERVQVDIACAIDTKIIGSVFAKGYPVEGIERGKVVTGHAGDPVSGKPRRFAFLGMWR